MPDLTPFAGALGPLLGAAIALVGTFLTLRYQFNLEVLRQRESLKNMRRERLMGAYESALLAAVAMQQAAARRMYLLEGETTDDRRRELKEMLDRTSADLDRAQIRLMLDPAAAEVREKFQEVRNAFFDHQSLSDERQAAIDAKTHPAVSATALGAKRDELRARVNELRSTMITSLENLGGPMTDMPQGSLSWRGRP